MNKIRNTFKGLLSVALLFLSLGIIAPQVANAQTNLYVPGTITANGGTVVIGPLTTQSSVTAQVTGTFVAVYTVKLSNDNSTYYTPLAGLTNLVTGATTASITNTGGYFSLQTNGARYVELTATGYTSGTITVKLFAGSGSGSSADGATASNQATQSTYLSTLDTNIAAVLASLGLASDSASSVGGTGTVEAKLRLITTILSAIQVAAESSTAVDVVPTGGTTQGALPASWISDNSSTSTVVKASPGTVYSINVTNILAAALYVRAYDTTTATCTSATGIVGRWIIPASATGAGATFNFPVGKKFATGISFCITTTVGDTNNTAIAANVAVFSADYK